MKNFGIFCLPLLPPFAALAAPAIPEPPLILYGTVTDAVSGATVTPTSVSWQVTNGSTLLSLATGSSLAPSIISSDGNVYYLIRVPLETRVVQSAGSPLTLNSTANTLPLASSGTNLSLVPTINNLPASVASLDGIATAPGSTPLLLNDLANAASHIIRADLRLHENAYSIWATQKFGSPTLATALSAADPDKDGSTNQQEYIAGTDPTNPNSTFNRPGLKRQTDGNLALTFATVPGHLYVMEQSPNLIIWTPTGLSQRATGSSHVFTITPSLMGSQAKMFYRISTTLLEVTLTGDTYTIWAAQNFGSSDSPLAQPTADPDGDGKTNETEFAAGTNPSDATSTFKNTSVAPQAGGSLALTFSTVAGKTYTLEQSTDLSTWTATGVTTTATSSSSTLVVTPTLTTESPRVYYRLSTSVP